MNSLQDPVITRAMRTGFGYAFLEPETLRCDVCDEVIDDYDTDAEISDVCICGRCWRRINYRKED